MKNFSIILGAIILMLFVTLVIWGVYCDNTIAITNYCVNNTKNDAKLKFVVITDLHNKEYGEKNADLAELVKEQNPDFIAVCGDMVNRGDPDTTKMKDVLEKLSKLHPHTAVSATMSVTMPPNSERILKAKQIQQALYCLIMNI